MTEKEWMNIGYEKGIIDVMSDNADTFEDVYSKWFSMKAIIIKPQSLDRIEVTYNKYFLGSEFVMHPIGCITDGDISKYLDMIIVKYGNITDKEMSRIWQIMNNVFVYARDCDVRSCPLHDWDRIKRQIPYNRLVKSEKHDEAVASKDVEELIYEVVERRIYSVHQCCSLLLCMNFYLGLRVGELAVLSFSDFDFDRNVVRIYKTETKFFTRDESGKRNGGMNYRVTDSTKTIYSVREIPILPEVKYFYDLIKKEHKDNGYESQYLAFDGTYGVFVRALDRTLRNLCKLCDIPYFSTHMIRKTFATKLHFANVPTRVISDILGHSEIGTTEKSYIKNYKDKWQMTYNYMKEGLVYGHN